MSSFRSGSPDFSKIPLENPPAGVTPNFDNPPSIIWHLTLISILGVILAIFCLALRLYTRFVLLGRGGGFEDGKVLADIPYRIFIVEIGKTSFVLRLLTRCQVS